MKISKNCYFIEKKKAPARKCKVLFFIFIFTVFLSGFLFKDIRNVFAQSGLWEKVSEGGLQEIGDEAFDGSDPVDVRVVTAYVIKVFLSFLGLIFLILIIMAGYKWMMAGGNSDQVDEAKSSLSRAVIGLAIVVFAYVIADFVISNLSEISETSV